MQNLRLIFISFLLFLSSCSNEYIAFHSQNNAYLESKISASKQVEVYDISKIWERNVELFSLPDKTWIDKIVNFIDNAKKRIYLEVYILTEKRIIETLVRAKGRWIDVRIILEKNVFWSPKINFQAMQTLLNAWILAIYASENNYVFTHSKFFIIDDFFLVSTGNMSHSTFTVNKEFFVKSSNISDLKNLEKIFEDDFNHKKSIICELNLISSPNCSREMISNLLKSAKSSIYIYAQEISDEEILSVLKEKKAKNLDIKLIIWDKNKIKRNSQISLDLKNMGIEVISPKKPYIHAKTILVDEEYIYIWSVNFTTNSFDNNREVGVIFHNAKTWWEIKKEFLKDFSNLQ
ncbi:MAG: putative membrane associated protein [uncultured bacterium (gcode 4)]|uniref:phospholipase D n=1 Tax=uncultured bacterium (gcode 4) TaxID=1234023 RepID=K2AX61_9BACT|nr:MAG: putative membrane associated protein [uncultured bacterium (gcode 4)]